MRPLVTPEQRALFPLRTAAAVVRLFALELDRRRPSLALLSVVSGAVEHSLTAHRPDADTAPDAGHELGGDADAVAIPPLEYDTVFALYAKFAASVLDAVDVSAYERRGGSPRELVNRVSDVIWFSLARSYHKDKPHIQSLYSFLTGGRLDCLGVAVAVAAACQLLEMDDVRLALSEDHSWLAFGPDATETAEVTWHGRGNEDRRGQPVSAAAGRRWLYLSGSPVICTPRMQVAVVANSISASLGGAADSIELVALRQRLLWLMYDRSALDAYPMALDALAALEEACPTPDRPKPLQLYQQAVTADQEMYGNHHVCPYTHLADYYYRAKRYELALATWADAADALRHYDYSRDDEEIYKKLMEITIDHIPHIIKEVGSGISAHSLLREPHCYLHLLRFYDGLCQWEQGSTTPVLHIGWAKQMVGCVSKFDPEVRQRVTVTCANDRSASNGSDAGDANSADVTADVTGDPNGNSEPLKQKPAGSVRLYSEKMAGLRDLLTSERFNPQAVSLQLTAQSQVSRRGEDEEGRRAKRQRREPTSASAE